MSQDRQRSVDRAGETDGLSPHHQIIISCLRGCGGRTSIVQLARAVAAHRRNQNQSSVPAGAIRRTYRELTVQRLDELTNRGLIEVCDRTGTVELCE